jgi:hypothetical protein
MSCGTKNSFCHSSPCCSRNRKHVSAVGALWETHFYVRLSTLTYVFISVNEAVWCADWFSVISCEFKYVLRVSVARRHSSRSLDHYDKKIDTFRSSPSRYDIDGVLSKMNTSSALRPPDSSGLSIMWMVGSLVLNTSILKDVASRWLQFSTAEPSCDIFDTYFTYYSARRCCLYCLIYVLRIKN